MAGCGGGLLRAEALGAEYDQHVIDVDDTVAVSQVVCSNRVFCDHFMNHGHSPYWDKRMSKSLTDMN